MVVQRAASWIRWLAWVAGALLALHAGAEPVASRAARILVDGEVGDWGEVALAHRDGAGDGAAGADFGGLWMANDEHYLFLRLEVGTELSLQVDNRLALYVDTDAEASTGLAVGGLGAELEWRLGSREGWLHGGPEATPVEHAQIGLITAPTVTAGEFEIVLERRAMPGPERPLFGGETIRVAFADLGPGGDALPDAGGVAYRFDDSPLPALPVISLARRAPHHLRFLSYNVNNHLHEPRRQEAFRRILGAIRPDVVAFQEVRDLSAAATLRRVAPMLPHAVAGAGNDAGWHVARGGGEDNVLLSPFPILSTHPLGGSAGFLLDLASGRQASPARLLLIVASAPCCDRERERQLELDLMMAFVRDARAKGGDLDLAPGTPIIILGDPNLVGEARQRRTLLTGAIVNLDQHGPSFAPDWDGSAFADLKPRHTHRPLTFTWYGRRFSPGRLDYVAYSDSVLEAANRFVLFTPHLPRQALARYNLRRDDVLTATDHLPVVVDFVLPAAPAAPP